MGGRLDYDQAIAEAYLADNQLRANQLMDKYIQDWQTFLGLSDRNQSSDQVFDEEHRLEELRTPISKLIADFNIEEPIDIAFILELKNHFNLLDYAIHLENEVSDEEKAIHVHVITELLKSRNETAQTDDFI